MFYNVHNALDKESFSNLNESKFKIIVERIYLLLTRIRGYSNTTGIRANNKTNTTYTSVCTKLR